MSEEQELHSAVAAGVLGATDAHSALLFATVTLARGTFGAAAASIMHYDAPNDELVFEAVAGAGSDVLVGQRMSSHAGIAGWVLASQEPIIVDDVRQDPRWARDVAERSGYLPTSLMSCPLLYGEEAIGVVNVIDRAREISDIASIDLLAQLAHTAAIALYLTLTHRRLTGLLQGDGSDAPALARVTARLLSGDQRHHAAAVRLLEALGELLE